MSCTHENLKTFQFKDGQVIYCCPDCTAFDLHRSAVLAGKSTKAMVIKEDNPEEDIDGEESFSGVEAEIAG
jgi:hypothetical protein